MGGRLPVTFCARSLSWWSATAVILDLVRNRLLRLALLCQQVKLTMG